MKAKEIEGILTHNGRLILRDYPFGERFFVENDVGDVFGLNKAQFYKFKETCANKDESQTKWLRGETTTWYYWR